MHQSQIIPWPTNLSGKCHELYLFPPIRIFRRQPMLDTRLEGGTFTTYAWPSCNDDGHPCITQVDIGDLTDEEPSLGVMIHQCIALLLFVSC